MAWDLLRCKLQLHSIRQCGIVFFQNKNGIGDLDIRGAGRKVCVDGAGVVPGAGVAVTSPQLRNFAVHSIRQCGID